MVTFLNRVIDNSYGALHNILMEDNSKIYEDYILSLRKKAVDNEDNRKGKFLLRVVASLKQDFTPSENDQVHKDVRHLPIK